MATTSGGPDVLEESRPLIQPSTSQAPVTITIDPAYSRKSSSFVRQVLLFNARNL